MALPYVADAFAPRRRPTHEVKVGDVGVGGANPIRLQSMTTTDTRDTAATVAQIERMVDAGCEIARVTAPSLREAQNLAQIKRELLRRGVGVPLVADIHYTPNAALIAAEHVEKVRINPGNFADKKKFEVREYSDAQYAEELERVAGRFRPLVSRCAELGRALRIGTNHGSLSDRIMNRFGDTPLGMVESALEFLAVCEEEGFRDVIFSMKASNAQVAIQAYRLLAARLAERATGAPSYPFHIGVTEAGDGEDGRIKSAIGIGSLLEDGIGDTIRVSLTEDPVREIPVAAALARRCETAWLGAPERVADPGAPFVTDPFAHQRRATRSVAVRSPGLGGSHPVRVELDLGAVPDDPKRAAAQLARSLPRQPELACEGLSLEVRDRAAAARLAQFARALEEQGLRLPLALHAPAALVAACAAEASRLVTPAAAADPDAVLEASAAAAARAGLPLEWSLCGGAEEISGLLDRVLAASAKAGVDDLLVSVAAPALPVHAVRVAVARLRARGAADVPVVLRHWLDPARGEEESLLGAAVDLGVPLCDGIGDAVSLAGFDDAGRAVDLAYRVLQGARLRTTRTEYISCPSCGRTLFDLEETTARIRSRTQQLRGVKIAVMGCIVNGPGEMADADFGYVGSGPGRVNLYVGKTVVARGVPEAEADDRLVELIRAEGRWLDP